MTRVRLDCITMVGNEYALFAREGGAPGFPSGALPEGEHPADAVRALVSRWTGTEDPKLELVDFLASGDELALVFRAVLTSEPKGDVTRAKRMELPEDVGMLSGAWVEQALKTSLNYKLTRR